MTTITILTAGFILSCLNYNRISLFFFGGKKLTPKEF